METQQNPQVNKGNMSPSFFFLSLGVLISLITSVSAFLNLVFETLNKRFPDVLNASYQYGYSTYQYEGMRMALAILIIFFPIYLVVSYFWEKFVNQGLMGRLDIAIRKWLIYIVLFLSALLIAIDLVTLIKYFVSGELTSRFILKVSATLITAVIVGAYYLILLRKSNPVKKMGLIFSVIGGVIVLSGVIYSFMIMGSPAKQRMLRLDDRRVTDLQSIQWAIINHWQQKERIPESLDELKDPLSSFVIPPDPEFEKGKVYEYKKIANEKNDLTFELCATFSLPMPDGWVEYGAGGVMPMYEKDVATSYPYPGPSGVNDSWDHEGGRTCFSRTIDRDLYPPFEKSVR